jgi:hypothetical protein
VGDGREVGDSRSLSTWGPCCSLQNGCAGTDRWTEASPGAGGRGGESGGGWPTCSQTPARHPGEQPDFHLDYWILHVCLMTTLTQSAEGSPERVMPCPEVTEPDQTLAREPLEADGQLRMSADGKKSRQATREERKMGECTSVTAMLTHTPRMVPRFSCSHACTFSMQPCREHTAMSPTSMRGTPEVPVSHEGVSSDWHPGHERMNGRRD